MALREIRELVDLVLKGDVGQVHFCLLYTSDAADDLLCVDLGGRRIIKKKTSQPYTTDSSSYPSLDSQQHCR